MDFYSPISRSQLETFEDLTERCILKCRSGEVNKSHINTEIVFKRALALANVREEVTVEKVLACPIGQIPTALFHDDGLMRKSCKSDLINLLEKKRSARRSHFLNMIEAGLYSYQRFNGYYT